MVSPLQEALPCSSSGFCLFTNVNFRFASVRPPFRAVALPYSYVYILITPEILLGVH